jgi:hypothetical protein
MRFWDSSAVVPLLVAEPMTSAVQAMLRDDPSLLVWWATEVECQSAIARLERGGELTAKQVVSAVDRLDDLARAWNEVQPTEPLRRTARRLLRVHPLRAADALQLAAALIASEGHPATLGFVSLDSRLMEVARKEGVRPVEVE